MQDYLTQMSDLLVPWLQTHGVNILLIVTVAFVLKRVAHRFIEKSVRITVRANGFASKLAEKQREDTLIYIFSSTVKIAIVIITGLMVIQEFGIMIGPVLAAAGIVGLAFGFGGQYLIRDIISGLFIILENQYRIGDVVKIGNVGGKVEEISLRKTTLRDLDGTVHHIPHGEVTLVSNLSKDFSRVNLDIGISYQSNLEKVIEVVNKTGEELAKDPEWKELIIKAPAFLRVNDFADSSIMIKILGETAPQKQWEVAGEFRKRLKMAFDKAKIEIPFPQMVLHQEK